MLSMLLRGRKRPGLALAVRIERATGGVVKPALWLTDEEARPVAVGSEKRRAQRAAA